MATQHSFESSMARHPDIMAMRDRYDLAAGTPRAQVLEGLMFLGGAYAAISPWVIGFSSSTSALAINNLIIGTAIVVMTLLCASSFGRVFGMSWVTPLMGVWLIVSIWIMNGITVSTGTMISNIVVGACVLVFGAGVIGVAQMRTPSS
jgi:hypothetical protein